MKKLYLFVVSLLIASCGGGVKTPKDINYSILLPSQDWYTVCKDIDANFITHFDNNSFTITKYSDKNFQTFDKNKPQNITYTEYGFKRDHYEYTVGGVVYTDMSSEHYDNLTITMYDKNIYHNPGLIYSVHRTKNLAKKDNNLEECNSQNSLLYNF